MKVSHTLVSVFVAVISLANASVDAAPSIVMHSPTQGSNYVAYSDLKTPSAADTFCKNKQGHLAVINTHAEGLEMFAFLAEILPAGGYYNDIDAAYLLGASVLAGSTVVKNVTGQSFYQDPAGNYTGFDFYTPATTTLNLMASGMSSFYLFADLSTTPVKFVCEFEDSAI